MVYLLGVHAFNEADIIRRRAGMRHEITRPRTALAVLLEGLNRREHQLALRIPRHRAKTFARHKLLGHRLPVHFFLQRLVIKQIRMRRRAVHEKINYPLRLGRKMWKCA